MGFLRKEHWNGLLFPYPGDLADPGTEPCLPLGRKILLRWAPGEATFTCWKLSDRTKKKNSCFKIFFLFYNKYLVSQMQAGTKHAIKWHSVQFSSVTQSCPTLRPHESQHARSSLRLKSIESVMPSSHLILSRPLLLLPPIPPSIRVFSNESTLLMRWPKVLEFQL